MSDAAERHRKELENNTDTDTETKEYPNKPSDIRSRQREIEKKIERLEDRHDALGTRHHKMSERYARRGAPCPECGSNEKPKGGGFAQVYTATCPDCGFEGSCIH